MRRLLPRTVCSLVALLGLLAVLSPNASAIAKRSVVKRAVTPTTKKKVVTTKKAVATKKKTVVAKKAVVAKTTVPRVVVAKTVPNVVADTTPTIPITPSTPIPTATVVGGVPTSVPATDAVGNPGATDSTIPGATTTIPAQPTTTAPYPAGALPPNRPTAATLDPYRGLGTWLDAFDWTVQKGGKTPRVSAATVDAIAAVGVQTIFIQASRYDSADVAEPERLIPIINRAHELGLYVVVWYLPTFTDVNADLRRTVAIASLDVDGISIDIEARNVANVAERNRRLISYSQSLRTLLPGRLIANNIVQPNILDAVPNVWPTEYGKPPAGITSYWTLFPYVEIAPSYDFWMIQNYWTQRSAGGGWRDAYKISLDNATRLRAVLRRPDLPLQLIGGVGDKPMTTNDLAGMMQAAREVNATGLSFYDWLVTPSTWWSTFWNARFTAAGQAADPRFVLAPQPVYTAPTQPVLLPPTTTILAPTVPPSVGPGPTVSTPAPTVAATAAPTSPPTTPPATLILVG